MSFSQANTLVVFAEDPTPFYVILDGVKKNEIAKTRVVIPGIEQTNSSVKIYFKDESIAPVSKNIWWENANHNDEVSFRLVNTKRGYKLRYFSTKQNAPVATEAAATPAVPVQNTQAQTQNVQSTTTTTVPRRNSSCCYTKTSVMYVSTSYSICTPPKKSKRKVPHAGADLAPN